MFVNIYHWLGFTLIICQQTGSMHGNCDRNKLVSLLNNLIFSQNFCFTGRKQPPHDLAKKSKKYGPDKTWILAI